MKLVERSSVVLYSIAATTLACIALIMIAFSALQIWNALGPDRELESALLDAVGLIIVSVAVFDVAKFFMEEGVIHRQELRSPSEARYALTKFLSIITMAVALETLVFIFNAGRTKMSDLMYPAILLFVVIMAPVALGLFQRFSREAELIGGKGKS